MADEIRVYGKKAGGNGVSHCYGIVKRIATATAASLAVAHLFLPAPLRADVDPSTLDGKVLFGYQGWFDCPGNWGGYWSHWSGGAPSAANVQVEMYPDLTEFPKSDLCPAGNFTVGGAPAYFFSSRNLNVIDKHFKWMQGYGLDGVLIQRFVSDIPGLKGSGDQVLKNILAASAKYGRVVAIEYDVTGSSFTTWNKNLEDDWKYLVDQLRITAAPNYLHHKGKPLVSVWGIGLNESRNPPANSADAMAMVKWFHSDAPAAYQASVMGGAPAGFRTSSRDARKEAGWLDVWKAMDAVQPWNVGRYTNLNDIKNTYTPSAAADQKWLAASGITYMPVLFPGYSQSNAIRGVKKANEIPRLGGNFIWQQAVAVKNAGAGAIKIAMFDEVNEATAMFKVVSKRSESPAQGYWLALDGDGMDLPSDWYLRLSAEITKIHHGVQPASAVIPINPAEPYHLGTAVNPVAAASHPAFRWSRMGDGMLFTLDRSGGALEKSMGRLEIRDLRGMAVRTLSVTGGAALWDMRDEGNRRVTAGMYLARLRVDGTGAGMEEMGKAEPILAP